MRLSGQISHIDGGRWHLLALSQLDYCRWYWIWQKPYTCLTVSSQLVAVAVDCVTSAGRVARSILGARKQPGTEKRRIPGKNSLYY